METKALTTFLMGFKKAVKEVVCQSSNNSRKLNSEIWESLCSFVTQVSSFSREASRDLKPSQILRELFKDLPCEWQLIGRS